VDRGCDHEMLHMDARYQVYHNRGLAKMDMAVWSKFPRDSTEVSEANDSSIAQNSIKQRYRINVTLLKDTASCRQAHCKYIVS